MMSLEDILEERNRIFTELTGQFAVLSPSVTVEGRFEHGKVLKTSMRETIDLTGMDSLALGCLEETRGSLGEGLRALDGASPASAVVTLMSECREAEHELGRWIFPEAACPEAILFFLGFDANWSFLYGLGCGLTGGVLSPFRRELAVLGARPIPTVFLHDRYLHYSGQAGIRGAALENPHYCFRYAYRDYAHLESLLRKKVPSRHGDDAFRIIVTDALLSTTGEAYDMETLIQIAEQYDCLLYVDEAHAGGSIGDEGRGVTAGAPSFTRAQNRIIIMATLIKAVCLVGGFIAFASGKYKHMFEWMSPHRVFSATPPPYIAAEIVKRVRLLAGPWGEQRRETLRDVVGYARRLFAEKGFDILGDHHICALSLDPRVAGGVRSYLAQCGFLVAVFEPPALPRGRALLRFGLRADLTETEIDRFVAACCEARRKFNFVSP